jgi:hypothetical protein
LDFQSDPQRYKQYIKSSSISSTKTHEFSLVELWNATNSGYSINSGPAVMVAKDLFIRGLSRSDNMRNAKGKLSTKLGDEFLSYIREPLVFLH